MFRTYDEKHYGLYQPSVSLALEEEEETAIEHLLNKEQYVWVREYTTIPCPTVEPENNFFFIKTGTVMNYARYKTRIRVVKRAAVSWKQQLNC